MGMTSAARAATAMALLAALPRPAGAARSDSVSLGVHLGMVESGGGCDSYQGEQCDDREKRPNKNTGPQCFLRQKGDKCVPATPDNCPGMNRVHCDKWQDLCHYDHNGAGGQWEKACMAGPDPAKSPQQPACVVRKEEMLCKKDCLWRPSKDLKCAPKEAKYCQGVQQIQCKQETETCHWQWDKDWEHSCKGGKAEDKPKPKHQPAKVDCGKRDKTTCTGKDTPSKDKACMFHPKGSECVPASEEHCKGMNKAACEWHSDMCEHKSGVEWTVACEGKSKKQPASSKTTSSTKPTSSTKTTSSTTTSSTTTTPKSSSPHAADECKNRGKDKCMEDKMCFYHAKGAEGLKCVKAVSENCPGLSKDDCNLQNKCTWDWKYHEVAEKQKDGLGWTVACRPGGADQKPITAHQQTQKTSSSSTTSSTTSTKPKSTEKTKSSTSSTTSTKPKSTEKTTSSSTTTSTEKATTSTTTSSGAPGLGPGALAALAALAAAAALLA